MEPRLEDYFVEITESLVGQRAGAGAAAKARQLRRHDRLGFARSLLVRQHTDERAWRRGASGERFVGFILGRLPKGWHVFHDVPVGDRGANIDHVVVGPSGTFTLNTKNLTGKIWVGPHSIRHNGHPTKYLPASVFEAERASRLLAAAVGHPVDVRGVLAILVDEWTITQKPIDVHVGSPRGARDWMVRLPATLSPHDVIEIAAAASKPATWTTHAGSPCSCGGELVERRRRTDGGRSLGCSRYPQCRRTSRSTSI